MEEALRYLRGLRGPIYEVPLIPIVGDICRTWYDDHSVLCAVLEILRSERMFQPVHTRPWGFDLYVKQVSQYVGLVPFVIDPAGYDSDGRSIRDPGMLDGAAFVVAFPKERAPEVDSLGKIKKGAAMERMDWRTSDPALVQTIEEMSIPVLVVYRDGATSWIAPGEAT